MQFLHAYNEDCADADLSLHGAHMSEDTFSHDAAGVSKEWRTFQKLHFMSQKLFHICLSPLPLSSSYSMQS